MMKTYAPWSEAQVAALNAYQASGRLHPFTCPHTHHSTPPLLVAHRDGWHCPDGCGYTQSWAHEWMADGEPVIIVSAAAESFRERILRKHRDTIDLLSGVVDLSVGRNAEDCEICSAAVHRGELDYPWICRCEESRRPAKQVCAVLHTDAGGNAVPCPDIAPEGLQANPPGSRRDQLPDRILALLVPGVYISTACETAIQLFRAVTEYPDRSEELAVWEKRMHLRCRLNHKFTGTLCECHCHEAGEVIDGVVLPQSLE